MKSYTDIEQSKKLTEILPIDSADMWWSKNFIYYNPTAAIGISAEYSNVYTYKFGEDDIPCWSLVALLNILPHSLDGKYHLELGNPPDNSDWYIIYVSTNELIKYAVVHSNLIDACYEMILKLHEEKII